MFLLTLLVRSVRAWPALWAGFFVPAVLAAQVSLTSGTHTQDFDGIGSGLPTGWTVHTGATASTLGTTATLVTTATAWSSTTGQWQNSASATGMTGTESSATQSAATNRALAVRQSGSFGDPGASATFHFSTSGLQVTGISFTAQQLRSETRSTTWSLQYAVGATPGTWTTIATFSDPGTFGSTTVTGAGYGTALDNQADVRLRVVALASSTGSGSRDVLGIDDFTIVTSSAGPVATPPSISTHPANATVTEGSPAGFSVVASGTGTLSYQWRKGGVPLANGPNITGADTASLGIASAQAADAGSYDVVVSSTGGTTTSNPASLTVNPAVVPPAITTHPSPQSVATGGTAVFSVAATGTGPLSYQWRRNGANLANGGRVSGATSATLTITSIQASDAGSYDVVVGNSVNTATSNPAALSISPAITPAGQVAYVGGSYVQDFNTLPASGTFTLTSKGPLALAAAPISASGLGGWSLAMYAGSGTVAQFRVDAGTSTSGSAYSYGTTSTTDRALGSLASGTTISRFGVTLVNNTGRTITEFSLSYRGEQWRRGGSANANTLNFEYGLGATDLDTGTFVAVPALRFTAPSVGAASALDGNAPANSAAVSGSVTGLDWAPGQTLILRWTDVDDPGSDDGLAIDDLTFSTPVAADDILPMVAYTVPADGTINIATNTQFSVVFNEAVNAPASAFELTGTLGGSYPFSVTGGPASYTVAPAAPLQEGDLVRLLVRAAGITDAETGTLSPTSDFVAEFVTFSSAPLPISRVQGPGLTSAYKGHVVTVEGVVVATFQGPGRFGGYYVQAPDAEQDSDPATSEGIYVFDNANSVTLGDRIRVTGTVSEFGTAPRTQTEITNVTTFIFQGGGHALPTPATVTLPLPDASFLERYEGMRVVLPQTLTVTNNFDLGRFGEFVLSNGRLPQPTNVVAPGAPAQAQAAANALNQLTVDDGGSGSYPDPTPYLSSADPLTATRRTGSTTTGAAGVLAQRFGNYALEPTHGLVFSEDNPRPATPPAVGGSLRVAMGNVLNFFNGDGLGGGFPTARGASSFAEYQRQRAKTVAALLELNADILGLIEVENDGFGPLSAIADLVNGLNAAAPAGTTYAYVDASAVNIVTDLIHSAFVYRVETVEPVGSPAMLNSPYFNNVARNPLAQTFREKATGGVFTASINHFRAKASVSSVTDGISPNPNNDQGDGQGTNNYLRRKQAEALVAWLATDPTGSGDPDFLIIGDLNAYTKEDPITTIRDAGYVNLTEAYEGASGYSYQFAGAFGHLDHALATAGLAAQVTGTATWHVNADEPIYLDYNLENKSPAQQAMNVGTPYRYSDHDPVIVGLSLHAPPVIVTPPAPQSVTVGQSAAFSVVVKGTPTPTFQWRRNGVPISGAESASFTIASAVTADAGDYDVVVSNPLGVVTSAPAVLAVQKAVASVSLGGLAAVYDGAAHPASVTTVPAGLNVVLTYDGAAPVPVNAGSYAVVATVVDVNYTGSASGTLVIAPATASVSLGNLDQVFDGTPRTVTVTTTPSGLPAAVTYDGAAAAPTAAGSYAVAATVTDPNYTGSATGTLNVAPAPVTLVLGNLVQPYDGTPRPVTVTTTPSGLPVSVTYDTGATPPTYPGVYGVSAQITDPNHAGKVDETLVVTITALVRRGPTLDGALQGSLQVLQPDGVTLNGTAAISGDLLLPGMPEVRLNGKPVFAGMIDAAGAAAPAGHVVTLNGTAALRHLVRRVNSIGLPAVAMPPVPAGTRQVTLNLPGQSPGDFATLRDLTLGGSAGQVVVPPGTYGTLTANGQSSFALGVAGSATPAVYNLQALKLQGNSRVVLRGPVTLNLATGLVVSESLGVTGNPDWLELNLATGGLTLNGSATFDGHVLAPAGAVTLNGRSQLHGGVMSDQLSLGGGTLLAEPRP